jgi:hypothetical protein
MVLRSQGRGVRGGGVASSDAGVCVSNMICPLLQASAVRDPRAAATFTSVHLLVWTSSKVKSDLWCRLAELLLGVLVQIVLAQAAPNNMSD